MASSSVVRASPKSMPTRGVTWRGPDQSETDAPGTRTARPSVTQADAVAPNPASDETVGLSSAPDSL